MKIVENLDVYTFEREEVTFMVGLKKKSREKITTLEYYNLLRSKVSIKAVVNLPDRNLGSSISLM